MLGCFDWVIQGHSGLFIIEKCKHLLTYIEITCAIFWNQQKISFFFDSDVWFYRALQSVPRRHNTFYNSTEFRVHELNKRLQQRSEVIVFTLINVHNQKLLTLLLLLFIHFHSTFIIGKWQLLVGCFCNRVLWRRRVVNTNILLRRWPKAI